MVRTNREVLTGGNKYAQKLKQKHRVQEVVFDKDARKEYLTGFHKRKVQRQKTALEYNAEQERLARIEERRKIREEKKEDILRQLDLYNNKLKDLTGVVDDSDDDEKSNDEDDEWNGFDDDKEDESEENEIKGILKRKEVYSSTPIDTELDQLTTVTIESMEPNEDNLEVIAKSNFVDLSKSKEILKESIDRAKKYAVIAGNSKPKIKKKKFRYLSKSERKQNVRKEKSKSHSRKKDK